MIRLERYTADKFDTWNAFVEKANNGTIFHRLDFLAYHGSKFEKQEHHLMFYKGDHLAAVLPMGIFEENGIRVAKSPYGASWGGLVFSDKLGIKYIMQITGLMLDYLKDLKIQECIITVSPPCYHRNYTNYFEFSLFSNGFSVINRENHLVVSLPDDPDAVFDLLDSKCRNQTRKGLQNFPQINLDSSNDMYYPVLHEDKVRHRSIPTHSKEDLDYLKKTLADKVIFDVATTSGGLKAGNCYFACNTNSMLVFYMSQQDNALGLNGTNALVLRRMQNAVANGFKYFDFGGSSLNSKIRNIGVSEFKESFGANGMFRDTYKITF